MTLRELGILLRATSRVLLDSDETEGIHVAEELTSRGHFAKILRAEFSGAEGRELLRDRPELRSDQVDFDALRRLPAGSLGNAYVSHLDRYGLSADSQATPTRYIDSPETAYLVRRFRQTHDVWHVLVDVGTEGYEEVVLHAFSWGQLGLPVSAMVIVFGTLKHVILEARWDTLRNGLFEAYRHGRAADPLLPIYWERHWEESLAAVRDRYQIQPCSRSFG